MALVRELAQVVAKLNCKVRPLVLSIKDDNLKKKLYLPSSNLLSHRPM